MSRRRVRSEIADSTAPGPGGVFTRRLGGGLYVYETSFFCRHNSRAHDRAQAARACRSTALTTPELTASGPSGPGPGRPGHARERTRSRANMPERPHFPACPGLRDHTGLRWTSEFCHRTPLARESVTKEAPCCRPSARDHGYCEVKC